MLGRHPVRDVEAAHAVNLAEGGGAALGVYMIYIYTVNNLLRSIGVRLAEDGGAAFGGRRRRNGRAAAEAARARDNAHPLLERPRPAGRIPMHSMLTVSLYMCT